LHQFTGDVDTLRSTGRDAERAGAVGAAKALGVEKISSAAGKRRRS